MANRKGSGRGGRKPAPVALKIASGMRADRIPTGSPDAPKGVPEAPTHLDDYEKEGWDQFVRDVDRLGLLSVVDGHSALDYAAAYGRGRHLDDDIRKRGVMVPSAHGEGLVVNSAIGAKEKCERIKMSIRSMYGLTPSDRGRLRATEQTVDEFEEFLKSKA
jgi:P27 family predicted phage terminase small subunit